MLQMRPMTQDEFRMYRKHAEKVYAQDLIEAGQSRPDDASARAEACIDTLLPDGLLTDEQELVTLRDSGSGERLGSLWYGVVTEGENRTLFIYDLDIEPAFRRQGWATRVLEALEDEARALHVAEIGLSVFNHNTAALALYREEGFVPVTTTFVKAVEPR